MEQNQVIGWVRAEDSSDNIHDSNAGQDSRSVEQATSGEGSNTLQYHLSSGTQYN